MLNLPKLTIRQWIVMFATILASFATSSYNRLLISSMPDLRGIWGLDVDESSILVTLACAPQLLLAPITPWLAGAFGVRKTVLPSSLLLIGMVMLIPFLHGYVPLVAAHAVVGALFGIFITQTVTILYRTLPIAWMIIAMAIYAFGLNLAMNSGAAISAIYIEQVGWKWIYWQTAAFMGFYFGIVYFCLPRNETVSMEALRKIDFAGMIFFCTAMTLFYIGLYQGERLGWFDSGLVSCCFIGGIVLLLVFVVNEMIVPYPWAPLHYLGSRNVTLSIFLTGCYTFSVTVNSSLITGFLESIHGHRPEQTGWALLPIPLFHLFFIPIAILLTRFFDGRLVFALGVFCFALAYRLGMSVTVDWKEDEFLPIAILLAMGTPLCHLGMMSLTFLNFRAEHRIGILAFLHVSRIAFPALATALIGFVERVGHDAYVYQLQEHLAVNEPATRVYSDLFTNDPASVRSMVVTEASVRAFQDAFQIGLGMSIIILVALLLMRPSKANPVFPIGLEPPVSDGNTPNRS